MNKLNKYSDKFAYILAWIWLITFIAFSFGLCTWSVMWVIRLWGGM